MICIVLYFLQAKLQPSNDITVFYKTTDGLSRIIRDYKEFIYQTTKQPMRPYPVQPGVDTIISDKTKVRTGLTTASRDLDVSDFSFGRV